uniref:Cytochrome P450 n=1 Tax=Arion vulgaris TaxID=1028688 RepID=A0A0B7B065_9EUPU
MFQIVLAIVVLLLVARWWSSGRRKNLPPSPGIALPIVGHVYLLPKDPMALLEKWRLKYGNMYMLKFGSQPVVLLHDFSIFQEALLKHHDVFMDRHEKFLTETILENKGIFSLNGEQWKEQRHFVHRTLRDLGMGKNIMAERMHIEIKHYLQTIADTNGEPTDFAVLINATICNVISSIVFGGRFNHTDEKFLELLSVLNFFFHKFGSSAQVRVFPFLRYLPGDFFLYHELLKRAKRMKAIIWEIINTEGRKVNVNDDSFEDLYKPISLRLKRKKLQESQILQLMLRICWLLFGISLTLELRQAARQLPLVYFILFTSRIFKKNCSRRSKKMLAPIGTLIFQINQS